MSILSFLLALLALIVAVVALLLQMIGIIDGAGLALISLAVLVNSAPAIIAGRTP